VLVAHSINYRGVERPGDTGRVTTFEAHAPRAVDAACWL